MNVMVNQQKDKPNNPFWSFFKLCFTLYQTTTSFLEHLTSSKNLEQEQSQKF